jgi:hypothetical protein
MRSTLGDDWHGAWDEVPWSRPDDWREVADLLAWDMARLGAGWAHLEAAHQRSTDQRSVMRRLDALSSVLRADLPYLLGVGPTSADAADQPQLPLILPDEPPLENLADRPGELSWRLYFWMVLESTLDRALDRATPLLRRAALEDRGAIELPDNVDGAALTHALAPTFPPGTTTVEIERWWHRRAAEDRGLGRALGEQIALQVELLLREQMPTVLPLLEESIAVGIEDAALGGAIHVETFKGRPAALRLVSYEGVHRAPIWLDGDPDATLRELVEATARAAPVTERAVARDAR